MNSLHTNDFGLTLLLGHFGPVCLLQVSKNDEKNVATKSNLALEHFFLTVGQTIFGNKMPFLTFPVDF